jgi:hypothetical protein
MQRAKHTLDATVGLDHEQAVQIELVEQQWSMEQPWITERVAKLRQQLANRTND